MSDEITIEKIAETMFKLVEGDAGMKKYKPGDLTKKMIEHYGEDQVDKKNVQRRHSEPGRRRQARLHLFRRDVP